MTSAGTTAGGDFDLSNPTGEDVRTEKSVPPQTIHSSTTAYRDLNATLGNFYEQPSRDNAEMDELMERISSLETELGNEKEKGATVDEQVALMEKSYELAAKYMGGQNGGQTGSPSQSAQSPVTSSPAQNTGKSKIAPVKQVSSQVVSALGQPMSNAEFMAAHAQERNYGFNTAVGGTAVSERNTLSACVYGAQSVTDGQAVKLRLLEPMAVADMVIPRNALLVGAAKIQGVGKWAVCGRVRAATDKQAHAATLNLFTSAVHEYEDLQSDGTAERNEEQR